MTVEVVLMLDGREYGRVDLPTVPRIDEQVVVDNALHGGRRRFRVRDVRHVLTDRGAEQVGGYLSEEITVYLEAQS